MAPNDKSFFDRVNNLSSDFHVCTGAYDYNMGFTTWRPGHFVDNLGNLQGYAMFSLLESNGVFSKAVSDVVFDVVVECDELLFDLITRRDI